ncbi:MAG TPA: peptidylprolyl isomerase [Bryobacteraceae bacterium]|jgi:peptidyl-prolyl cis-trans isomerase A (cyclophilin A)|nr:peptidylprolyl isomerase [Bryobacteraceae bacterium]
MRLVYLLALSALACSAQTPPPAAAEVPSTPGLYAVIDTSVGQIVAELFEKQAPATVKNFVDLAKGIKAAKNKSDVLVKRPYYNGLTFHRVIKGFMIQTGDVKATGSTDCGFHIKDEIDPALKFDTVGRLAMANTGAPNTGACQFFITVSKPTYLNGSYPIFGQVVAGQDVADKISQVPTSNKKPIVPVVIKSITIQRKE